MSFFSRLRMLSDCLAKLKPRSFKVVTMPDFFLDRLVSYEGSVKCFHEEIVAVAKREGGSVDCVEQTELRGGNAANTAAALASLDAKVHPIIFTSQFGLHLLKFYFEPLGVDLSHVKTDGQTSITTAVEFSSRRGKVNVMLRDLGSLADLSFDHLDQEDFDLLREAEYVCVFNWAGTRFYGTELVEGVFRYVKEEGKGKTYYDTADPNPNKKEIPRLMKEIFLSDLVDILSVNENEAVTYASQLNEREVKKLQKTLTVGELTKECGRILAENISARVDLHTSSFATSFTNKCETLVPTFNIPVLRTTGAGDAWNAGNILGDAYGLTDADRLTLANAVAAYYISNIKAEHPNIIQLRKFLDRMLNQKIE